MQLRAPSTTARWRRRSRRAVLAHRRPLAALVAALAALAGLQAVAPEPQPTRTAVTAAHELPAGTVLTASDLALTEFLPRSVPAGALSQVSAVLGRTTTGPVRQGEPITDVRLVTGSLLEGYPGLVAAPVRVADAGAVGLLRVGDVVDVISADPQGRSEPTVVAGGAPVLALPQAQDGALASGGLVVLAVTPQTARTLAASAVSGYLSVTISG